MAELRIQIDAPDETGADELHITIVKRRGGWPVSGLRVALDRGRSNAQVQQQLSLWRLWRVRPQIAPGERQPEAIPYLPAAGAQQHVTH